MVLSQRKWIHPHESILNGKVTYQVKLIGATEVTGPRGMNMVKEALQKLKFNRQIQLAEGKKPTKVILSINVNGVMITDLRTKEVLHDILLQQISFCADDKNDKRIFSFIAKGGNGKHYCYGLDSPSDANDITLTIGQAFELAYDKYLKSEKGLATSKQVVELNERINELSLENGKLRNQLIQLQQGQSSSSSSHSSSGEGEHIAAVSDQHSQATTSQRQQQQHFSEDDPFDMKPFVATQPLLPVAAQSCTGTPAALRAPPSPRRRHFKKAMSVGVVSTPVALTTAPKMTRQASDVTKLALPPQDFISLDDFDPLKSSH